MIRTAPPDSLRTGDALIVVDVQNEFLPGGPLAVRQGGEVIPVLNEWLSISKGTRADGEACSGFEGADLHARLPQRPVSRPWIGGRATDHWVLYTVQDALTLRYKVCPLFGRPTRGRE